MPMEDPAVASSEYDEAAALWQRKEVRRAAKIGNSRFYVSPDSRFFYKWNPRKIAVLEREHQALISLQRREPVPGVRFLTPIGFLDRDAVLITRYVPAPCLVDCEEADVFEKWGGTLRRLHAEIGRHGHLQVNDVLYAEGGMSFTVGDVGFMEFSGNVLDDLLTFKESMLIFQIKRPRQRWRLHYEAFRAGYGFVEDEMFRKRLEERMRMRRKKVVGGLFKRRLLTLAARYAWRHDGAERAGSEVARRE